MVEPKVTRKKITDYLPDAANANRGTERGHRVLDDSITEVGLGRSVLADKNGILVAGNKTQQAAVENGFEDAIEIETDGKTLVVVKRTDYDLNDPDPANPARKAAYYDNRAGQLGLDWSPEQLLADLNAGVKLDNLFSEDELAELLTDVIQDMSQAEDEPTIEQTSQLQRKWQVQRGDIWTIGSHRLICGDSLQDELPDLPEEYVFFCDPFFGDNVIDILSKRYGFDTALFVTGGKQIRDVILHIGAFHEGVMLGGAFGPQWGVYTRPQYEHKVIIWTGKQLNFGVGYSSVLRSEEGAKRLTGDVYHHHAKPIDLVAKMLLPFSQTTVVDAFAGTGAVFLAAERLGRVCYGIEIEPSYCAATLERLSLAGLSPVKQS